MFHPPLVCTVSYGTVVVTSASDYACLSLQGGFALRVVRGGGAVVGSGLSGGGAGVGVDAVSRITVRLL
jgi:hypothetical protein